jgi:hypothetical protein
MVSKKLTSRGLTHPLKFESSGFDGEFFKTITRDSYHISLAIKDEIESEISRGEFRILSLPDDITLNLDVVGFESSLSTPLAHKLVESLSASFEP